MGNEFYILLDASLEKIAKVSSKEIAEAIYRVRTGNIVIHSGYDGVFGTVKVFDSAEKGVEKKQLGLVLE